MLINFVAFFLVSFAWSAEQILVCGHFMDPSYVAANCSDPETRDKSCGIDVSDKNQRGPLKFLAPWFEIELAPSQQAEDHKVVILDGFAQNLYRFDQEKSSVRELRFSSRALVHYLQISLLLYSDSNNGYVSLDMDLMRKNSDVSDGLYYEGSAQVINKELSASATARNSEFLVYGDEQAFGCVYY